MGRLGTASLTSLLLLLFMVTSVADDHEEAYQLLQSGEILPLEKILAISREQIQGHILEVELEHEHKQLIYELEVLDKNGIVWEIKLDAKTGAILKQEQEDD